MELLGFGWTEILAALGASAAALIALHLVRLRRRVVEVPSLAFFAEALPDERSHRSFARLRNLLLLVLMLLAAAAIALGMGVPEFSRSQEQRHDVVLLIDATASMQARVATSTRFERAREEALRTIESLPSDSRVLLMRMANEPEVVLPWTRDRAVLRRTLATMSPSESAGSAEPALSWARATCTRAIACRTILFTDGGLAGLDAAPASELEVHLVAQTDAPQSHENAAISAFSARRFPADPTRAEVLVDVTNYGSLDYEGTLTLWADDIVLHREPLQLAPHAHTTRSFDRITGVDAQLTARIESSTGDVLALDDTAYARIPPRRRRRVTLVGSSHAYLDAALLLDTFLQVRTMEPEAFEAARSTQCSEDDVWIFDGYTPRDAPTVPSLLLHPSQASWLDVGEPISRPRFVETEREHPVLRYIALGDVNIAEASPLLPRRSLDQVLAADPRGALLMRGTRGEVPFLALGFDVRASDFALRIGWPVFLLQSISHLSPDEVSVTEGSKTGETVSLPWPSDIAPALRLQRGEVSTEVLGLRHGTDALFTLSQAGAYLAPDGSLRVANLFDASESSLPQFLSEEHTEAPTPRPSAASPLALLEVSLTSLCVILALALLAVEWLLFHRRSA